MKKLAYILFGLLLLNVNAAHAQMQTSAKQAYIVDMGTGMVLLDKNADEKMPTSSMSKVMTAYMVFEALKQGRIQMDTQLPVSEKAWKKGGSKMFVEVGKKVSVENLLKGLIVQSGNDAAIVLAEGIAGDEDQFAKASTARAHEMGMTNSQFMNASGWPDPDHYSTAKDLGLLAQRLIVDFPNEYSIYSMKEFTFNGIRQPNRNPLLYKNMGVDGIKTGHTEIGGYGLMASGEVNGRRVVMVVNGLESMEDRANESSRLMAWALNGFENKILYKAGQAIQNTPVTLGKSDFVPVTVSRDVNITIPKGQEKNVTVAMNIPSDLTAPIDKGQQIGDMTISVPQMGDFKVALIAAESVEKKGIFGQLIHKIKGLL